MYELIYVASPYNHPDPEIVKSNFEFISKKVAERVSNGEVVFSPITYGHILLGFHEMPSSWEFWNNFCITFLLKSNKLVVYKMPGWEVSKGVQEEISVARDHNIPIEYIEV